MRDRSRIKNATEFNRTYFRRAVTIVYCRTEAQATQEGRKTTCIGDVPGHVTITTRI